MACMLDGGSDPPNWTVLSLMGSWTHVATLCNCGSAVVRTDLQPEGHIPQSSHGLGSEQMEVLISRVLSVLLYQSCGPDFSCDRVLSKSPVHFRVTLWSFR